MTDLLPTERRLGFPPCMVPPKGWVCTREPGHEGPCAAHPVGGDIAAEQIERLKACLKESHKAYLSAVRGRAEFRTLVREMLKRVEAIP